jgi:hypothetical protein
MEVVLVNVRIVSQPARGNRRASIRIPVLGWLMRLAGDIPVDRGNPRSAAEAMVRCKEILKQKVGNGGTCSRRYPRAP